jgi:threonylcarbamoyladenosine tRNA methylthiotransferase MtaB
MRYAVVTFGCRVNQADSLAVEAGLTGAGAVAVPPDRADVVLVNTCSVTANADQGARQTIRRIHRENPSARIIVTGCYASRCVDEVAALPGVAQVVRNDDKPRLLALLRPAEGAGGDGAMDGPCGRMPGPGLMGRTAWTLRAQTGCDEPCSYCIIPTTRGTSRSRALPDVLDELVRAVDAGYREVVLTGVHLGAWGRDLGEPLALEGLLAGLASVPGDFRVRVSSLEPMDCTAAVITWLVDRPDRFAPHLHLPLQHASDTILRAMRRPYTSGDFARLVDGVRDRLPHAAIGSDVIVGFPGETGDDAEVLAAYLVSSPLTHLHVFPYSDRAGTVASALPGKVHGLVVKDRALRLRTISRALSDRFRAAQAGTTRPALTIDDGAMAVTDNYFKVPVPGGSARNQWIQVAIPASGA